jgi:hypothetical protein
MLPNKGEAVKAILNAADIVISGFKADESTFGVLRSFTARHFEPYAMKSIIANRTIARDIAFTTALIIKFSHE